MAMRSRGLICQGPSGFHRLAVREWGDPANPRVLVCVHGLTRNSLDFETLAEALADRWRVVAPDMAGRGESQHLGRERDYDYATYCADMASVIASTGAERVDWVGTSMGGIIGMMLAAVPGSPIRRMVLNDIGPVISAPGLRRIQGYAGTDPRFRDFEAAYAAIRPNTLPFGPMTEAQRRRFVEIGTRLQPDGSWRMSYDPTIAWAFKGMELDDIRMWEVWDAIRCPVLVLRGAESDLLTAATVAEMRGRGPGCEAHEVPGVGHTPALMDDEQIDIVRRFLNV